MQFSRRILFSFFDKVFCFNRLLQKKIPIIRARKRLNDYKNKIKLRIKNTFAIIRIKKKKLVAVIYFFNWLTILHLYLCIETKQKQKKFRLIFSSRIQHRYLRNKNRNNDDSTTTTKMTQSLIMNFVIFL